MPKKYIIEESSSDDETKTEKPKKVKKEPKVKEAKETIREVIREVAVKKTKKPKKDPKDLTEFERESRKIMSESVKAGHAKIKELKTKSEKKK